MDKDKCKLHQLRCPNGKIDFNSIDNQQLLNLFYMNRFIYFGGNNLMAFDIQLTEPQSRFFQSTKRNAAVCSGFGAGR